MGFQIHLDFYEELSKASEQNKIFNNLSNTNGTVVTYLHVGQACVVLPNLASINFSKFHSVYDVLSKKRKDLPNILYSTLRGWWVGDCFMPNMVSLSFSFWSFLRFLKMGRNTSQRSTYMSKDITLDMG